MNQEEITAFVLERLEAHASHDAYAWYPATGWFTEEGAHGLAAELFGRAWSDRQLEKLARVLFRLGSEERIEVAMFRRDEDATRLPRQPHRVGGYEVLSLLVDGSRKLDRPECAYAARLNTTT